MATAELSELLLIYSAELNRPWLFGRQAYEVNDFRKIREFCDPKNNSTQRKYVNLVMLGVAGGFLSWNIYFVTHSFRSTR